MEKFSDYVFVFGLGGDRDVLAGSSHGRNCEVCGGYGRGEHGEYGQTNDG